MSDCKIAFFVSGLRPGGISRFVINLSQGFVKKGVHVDILLPQKVEAYHHVIPEEVNIINLNTNRILKSFIPLIRYLKQSKPYALISANDYVNIVAIKACKRVKSDTKIVSTIHIDRRNIEDDKKFKGFLFNKLAQKIYPHSDFIVAVSNGVADNATTIYRIPKNSIEVIFNPIIGENLQQKMKEKVDHRWLKGDNYKIILGVGRLTKQKDFPILINAFNVIRQKRPVKLIILGEGEERRNLQELIRSYRLEEDIDLPGFVDNPYSYMKSADLFVLSSRYEGFGNVIVESMAVGTPVVSTDCPSGPAEILENGKYGSLVPVGDVPLLAEAIEKALDEPADAEALKTRAMDFSIDKITEEYARLLNLV